MYQGFRPQNEGMQVFSCAADASKKKAISLPLPKNQSIAYQTIIATSLY